MRVLAAVVAASAFTPAWSYVPSPLRARLAAQEGGTLYLPAKTPLFYRYRSGASVIKRVLYVRFVDRVRVRKNVWRWTGKSFLWEVRPLARGARCPSGAEKTYQLRGNRVFAASGTAWRCVRGHVLLATDGGTLPDVALATAVASGLDVSPR
jgi:hypothetical protein